MTPASLPPAAAASWAAAAVAAAAVAAGGGSAGASAGGGARSRPQTSIPIIGSPPGDRVVPRLPLAAVALRQRRREHRQHVRRLVGRQAVDQPRDQLAEIGSGLQRSHYAQPLGGG